MQPVIYISIDESHWRCVPFTMILACLPVHGFVVYALCAVLCLISVPFFSVDNECI